MVYNERCQKGSTLKSLISLQELTILLLLSSLCNYSSKLPTPLPPQCETWWASGKSTGLLVKKSRFKTCGVIALWSWACAKHLNFTMCLSTQEYDWVLVDSQGSLIKCWREPCNGLGGIQQGGVIILITSCHRNQDKFRLGDPLGSGEDLT